MQTRRKYEEYSFSKILKTRLNIFSPQETRDEKIKKLKNSRDFIIENIHKQVVVVDGVKYGVKGGKVEFIGKNLATLEKSSLALYALLTLFDPQLKPLSDTKNQQKYQELIEEVGQIRKSIQENSFRPLEIVPQLVPILSESLLKDSNKSISVPDATYKLRQFLVGKVTSYTPEYTTQQATKRISQVKNNDLFRKVQKPR